MKIKLLSIALCVSALISHEIIAGEPVAMNKNTITADVAPYESGRGLLTLEGPTGMFINPTSATLPKGAYTLQYCFLLPNNETDIVGHNLFTSYGVTDWLEIGAIVKYIDLRAADDSLASAGPVVRVRLRKDEGWMPQISVGGYANFGDQESYNVFAAAYKRYEIDRNGFFRSIGFNAGIRETWVRKTSDSSNTPIGYFGAELQLPLRFYLVGEISTKNHNSGDLGGDKIPYAFGVQWRLGGINISTAMLQPGALEKVSFFFGIGTQLKF